MPNVTGGKGSFGGSAQAGRDASNTGTGRSSSERAAQTAREKAGGYTTGPGNTFTSTSGLSQGITVSPGAALQKQNQERLATYNSAAGQWNNSAKQRSIGNLVNALAPGGFSMEPPDITRPQTFGGGTYHVGWNPGSLLSLAGAMVPGSGVPLGMLGSAGYTALGGKNPIITGPGSQGMQTWDAPGQQQQNPASPGAMTPGGGQNADRTGMGQNGAQHLQNLAQLNQGVSGNPNAPQSVGGGAGGAPIQGPNYATMLASNRQITPGYGVQLPGYQYLGRPGAV